MCGLFGGISTTLVTGELNNIGELAVVSQLRGMDSTGIAIAKHRKKRAVYTKVMKAVDNASNFMWNNEVVKEMYDSKDRPFLILGHCRAATLGEVSDNNAHPFDMGNIIGAHNGTVHSIRGKSETGTDSEALFKILSEEGLQETVNAAKHGAYALTWIDTNKHTLNIIRNSQRPLYTMLARGVLYWASEFYMLRLVGHRDNINTVPEMLEVDTHLEIDLHNPLINQFKKHVAPVYMYPMGSYREQKEATTELKKVEPEKKPEVKTSTNITELVKKEPDFNPLAWEKDRTPKTPTTTSVPSVPPPSKSAIVCKYKGFRGKTMDLAKAKYLLREGCAFCTHEVGYGDSAGAFWFNNKQYLCKECAANPDAKVNVNAREVFKGEISIEGDFSNDQHCGHC